jgi:anthranilate synthase component 2
LKVLLVDFYDSFTYNIVHYIESLCADVTVLSDHLVELDAIYLDSFDALVLSPGPGLPEETKSMYALLDKFALQIPVLGICLGMQGIAQFFGGELFNLEHVTHGVSKQLKVTAPVGLFADLPSDLEVGLYHSWAISSVPDHFLVTSRLTENGVVMSIAHKSLPVFGVQFHPESILTPHGKQLISNFLRLVEQSKV